MSAESMATPPPADLDRQRLRSSLILILIGGPLVLLDVTISSGGGRGLDVLNDTIGWVLILVALPPLMNQPGPANHQPRMQTILVLSVIGLIGSILAQIGVQVGALLALILFAVSLGGTILFCLVMRDLVRFHGFSRSDRAWQRSLIAVATIWGAAGLIGSLVAIARPGGSSFVQLSGADAIPLLLLGAAVILTPAIFLVVSLSTTLGELRRG